MKAYLFLLIVPLAIYAESVSYTCKLNQNEYAFDTLFGKDIINMSDSQYHYIPSSGDPFLPAKFISIQVPNNIIVTSITSTITDIKSIALPGMYDIFPCPPIIPLTGEGDEDWGPNEDKKKIVDKKNINVYEKNALYPEQCIGHLDYRYEEEIDSTAKLTTKTYVGFMYMPFQYNPVKKTLTLNTRATITYRYSLQTKTITPLNLHKKTIKESNKIYNIKGQLTGLNLKRGLYISNKFESFIIIK